MRETGVIYQMYTFLGRLPAQHHQAAALGQLDESFRLSSHVDFLRAEPLYKGRAALHRSSTEPSQVGVRQWNAMLSTTAAAFGALKAEMLQP